MFILIDNLTHKMFFKGIDSVCNKPSLTFYMKDALMVDTEDEARILADEYNLTIKRVRDL